jgi:hypothetical protein
MSADGGDDHGQVNTHLDIMHELGALGGKMEANFETLFRGQRTQAAELVKIREVQTTELGLIRERLAKVEVRRAAPGLAAQAQSKAQTSLMTWKRAGGIAVVVVTILGGMSAAYHEGVTLLVAIHHALFDPPAK